MPGGQHAALLPALQLLGALYLGGIFGRPLAMGKLGHFAIGGVVFGRPKVTAIS